MQNQAAKRFVPDVRDWRERIERLEEAQFTAVDVAQPGHRALIDERIGDGRVGQPGIPQTGHGDVDVELGGQ